MNGIPLTSEVLGAMITPAVLISASGLLVLSTSNRLSRVVDRVRVLMAELERLHMVPLETGKTKRNRIGEQLAHLSERALLLRSALTAMYATIGLLVATSILVGVVALVQWRYSALPVILGFTGACTLLYGSLLLIGEARVAVHSTLQEMRTAQEAVLEEGSGKTELETRPAKIIEC